MLPRGEDEGSQDQEAQATHVHLAILLGFRESNDYKGGGILYRLPIPGREFFDPPHAWDLRPGSP